MSPQKRRIYVMQQRGKLKNRLGPDFGRPLKSQIIEFGVYVVHNKLLLCFLEYFQSAKSSVLKK